MAKLRVKHKLLLRLRPNSRVALGHSIVISLCRKWKMIDMLSKDKCLEVNLGVATDTLKGKIKVFPLTLLNRP